MRERRRGSKRARGEEENKRDRIGKETNKKRRKGRETERRERARVRALKTMQCAHATTKIEWMSEFISERVCECERVCVSVYLCKRERERERGRERERERNVCECARKMGIKIWCVCAM